MCVTRSLCCQQKLTQCYKPTILQLKRKEAGSSPDNGIKERLVAAMLGEDRQEVALQDLSRPQLLPHVPRLILVPQVADQVLHTLFRDRTNTYMEPGKKLHPGPCALHTHGLRNSKDRGSSKFFSFFNRFPQKGTHLSSLAPCGKCLPPSTRGHCMWQEVHSSSCSSPHISGRAEGQRNDEAYRDKERKQMWAPPHKRGGAHRA